MRSAWAVVLGVAATLLVVAAAGPVDVDALAGRLGVDPCADPDAVDGAILAAHQQSGMAFMYHACLSYGACRNAFHLEVDPLAGPSDDAPMGVDVLPVDQAFGADADDGMTLGRVSFPVLAARAMTSLALQTGGGLDELVQRPFVHGPHAYMCGTGARGADAPPTDAHVALQTTYAHWGMQLLLGMLEQPFCDTNYEYFYNHHSGTGQCMCKAGRLCKHEDSQQTMIVWLAVALIFLLIALVAVSKFTDALRSTYLSLNRFF